MDATKNEVYYQGEDNVQEAKEEVPVKVDDSVPQKNDHVLMEKGPELEIEGEKDIQMGENDIQWVSGEDYATTEAGNYIQEQKDYCSIEKDEDCQLGSDGGIQFEVNQYEELEAEDFGTQIQSYSDVEVNEFLDGNESWWDGEVVIVSADKEAKDFKDTEEDGLCGECRKTEAIENSYPDKSRMGQVVIQLSKYSRNLFCPCQNTRP
uniref:SH3 domain-containing protein n=1 Tax=Rhabditophanes sp. KR3021 TaxID=114890 RepID=A0AC35TZG1_9BILA